MDDTIEKLDERCCFCDEKPKQRSDLVQNKFNSLQVLANQVPIHGLSSRRIHELVMKKNPRSLDTVARSLHKLMEDEKVMCSQKQRGQALDWRITDIGRHCYHCMCRKGFE